MDTSSRRRVVHLGLKKLTMLLLAAAAVFSVDLGVQLCFLASTCYC